MLTAALVAVGTLLYGMLIGYLTHWVLHQSWAGRVHRAHMNHHLKQYPPKNLISATYRSAGKDDSLLIAFIPTVTAGIALWLVVLWLLGVPTWILGVVIAESAFVGWLHDYVHDGFHLEGFWLARFAWFRHLRALHWLHHWNMRRNLGILWFGWDRLFKTFRATPHVRSTGRSA